jgi:hypothetical protein
MALLSNASWDTCLAYMWVFLAAATVNRITLATGALQWVWVWVYYLQSFDSSPAWIGSYLACL